MLFRSVILGFENGKAAKVEMRSYETKTNRKKLINAYSDSSPVVSINFIAQEDVDFAVFSDIGKLLVFNTAQIPIKSTRTNNGVQVMTSKKGSIVTRFVPLKDTGITDDKYYRTKNIPAKGCFIKEGTITEKQLSFDIIQR